MMAIAFLYFAGGGNEQDRIEKSVRVSCAGGINIGFSLFAFVSVVIACRDIGLSDSSPAFMTWITALAGGVFYFFTLRLIYGSRFSLDDQANGTITVYALKKLIPHILCVVILSMFIANTLAIELSHKEIDAYLQQTNAVTDLTDQNETIVSRPTPAGYMMRVDVANQLNPRASALIVAFFVFAGAGPLLIHFRRR